MVSMLDAFRHDRRGAMAVAFALTLLAGDRITARRGFPGIFLRGRLNRVPCVASRPARTAIALRTIDDGDLATFPQGRRGRGT